MYKLVIIVILFSISSCQRFYKIETTQIDGQLFFDSCVINEKWDPSGSGLSMPHNFKVSWGGKEAN